MCICANQPTNGSAAFTTYMLGRIGMTTGSYVYADGAVSGRRLTTTAASNVGITTAGSAQHIALVTVASGSTLTAVTTCDNQWLNASGSANIPAWEWNITDAT
jgi:hypothetical protein